MSDDLKEGSAHRGLTVAVVGATGAVGQDLLSALSQSPLPITAWRLFASRAMRSGTTEVDGAQLKVHVLPDDPAESPLFDDVDLVLLAAPAEVNARIGPALAEAGMAVIDVGGALAAQAPIVVAAVDPSPLARFAEVRIVSSPSPAAVLVATVLAPLLPLGCERARGTILLSAGVAGRDGVEELSGQVVALFNQGEPPRKVFPSGLAFDLLAQVGEAASADDGWSAAERRLSAEVAAVLGLQPQALALSLCAVPLFTGLAASLNLDFPGGVDLPDVRATLGEVGNIRLGDPVPGPRRLAGKAAVYVGRLRADPMGDGLHLWAAADNLRFGASANAVALALALHRTGML